MPLNQSSLAAANGVGAKNTQFQPSANVLPRKIVLIGTYDETTFPAMVENVPYLVTSPEDVGARFGWGFMGHRLAVPSFRGSGGVPTYFIPQPEDGVGVAADGNIVISGPATASGVLYLYISGIPVPVTVADTDTETIIGDKIVTAVTAKKELPVTAVNLAGTVTFTAKPLGPWGNEISITFNWGFNENFPAGVSVVVTPMANGAGLPDIDDALNALGVNDNANQDFNTEISHGYLQDSATLGKLSVYNGEGNDFVGCYKKLVARPLRSLNGDVAPGSAGLTALTALGNGRKLDRTSGIIAAPGSPNHPAEIAAWVVGKCAAINGGRAEESYNGTVMSGFIPGAIGTRWTDDYSSGRDVAVKAGIGTTDVVSGALVLKDVLTFYHPDSVPVNNNGYRNYRNISILQNILNSAKSNFSQDKWKGISIVADVAKVSNVTSRQKARETNAVIDDWVALAVAWEGNAWLYTAAFTIANITVAIRAATNGFDSVIRIILSGQGDIYDSTVEFDTSIAVLL